MTVNLRTVDGVLYREELQPEIQYNGRILVRRVLTELEPFASCLCSLKGPDPKLKKVKK